MTAWRDGIDGGFIDTAAYMTLRLDNAGALPMPTAATTTTAAAEMCSLIRSGDRNGRKSN
jgi:hypothetical protein